ncbi:kynurenine formamidase-like [Anticarsia gemmatalis]|uniref:kynurenine formamidase-like n=1 Tax=Anticarsia gemmatalis TaxID=129554 RepID=UPI003F768A61
MATVSLAWFMVAVSCLLIPLSVTADSLQDLLFSGNYEFIDLGHSFDNSTVYWPDSAKFKFIKKTKTQETADSFWYAANDFEAGEHGGTHMDAPYHFYQQGKFVGDLPLERLIVSLIIIDVSSKVNGNHDYVLYKRDMDYMINNNFGKPCIVIFKFGWSQYFNDYDKYLGVSGKTLRFPSLSAEVAEWITTYKNIVGVGVDVASVDPGQSTDFPVHKILSRAGLYNLENVNLHRPISEFKCTALVLPMKIAQGTGAPLRLIAICPKET